jgi:hypothetical protein
MTPKEIAEYADALWHEFKTLRFTDTVAAEFVKVALREKLRQEGNRRAL